MDGGGRLAEPLTGQTLAPGAALRPEGRARRREQQSDEISQASRRGRFAGFLSTWPSRRRPLLILKRFRRIRFAGIAASLLIIGGGFFFGVVRGGHLPAVLDLLNDGRNLAGNAVGFRIAAVSIDGHKHLSRDEILAIAGVNGRTSLLFLDAAETRARLTSNPWVSDATVQKLFPDRLAITIVERAAFALWQTRGQISVIAEDGTVLEAFVSRAVLTLPFVVGEGAATRAKEFLSLLDRHPELRDEVRVAVLIGERRWNLRLKSGMIVKLPESHVAQALERLVALDRGKKLLAREINVVDLRLADRVLVQLTESVAQTREEAIRARRQKPKGGNA